jgi:hypothetical protein
MQVPESAAVRCTVRRIAATACTLHCIAKTHISPRVCVALHRVPDAQAPHPIHQPLAQPARHALALLARAGRLLQLPGQCPRCREHPLHAALGGGRLVLRAVGVVGGQSRPVGLEGRVGASLLRRLRVATDGV